METLRKLRCKPKNHSRTHDRVPLLNQKPTGSTSSNAFDLTPINEALNTITIEEQSQNPSSDKASSNLNDDQWSISTGISKSKQTTDESDDKSLVSGIYSETELLKKTSDDDNSLVSGIYSVSSKGSSSSKSKNINSKGFKKEYFEI